MMSLMMTSRSSAMARTRVANGRGTTSEVDGDDVGPAIKPFFQRSISFSTKSPTTSVYRSAAVRPSSRAFAFIRLWAHRGMRIDRLVRGTSQSASLPARVSSGSVIGKLPALSGESLIVDSTSSRSRQDRVFRFRRERYSDLIAFAGGLSHARRVLDTGRAGLLRRARPRGAPLGTGAGLARSQHPPEA